MTPTPRQMDVLRFIHGFQVANGWSPSLAEIRDGLGLIDTKSAYRWLCILARNGLISKPRYARAIEVLVKPTIPQAPDGAPLYFVNGIC